MTDDPKSLVETAKAVQEVSKATGKAVDASREFGGFISRFIAGPLEQGVGIFEDRLRYMRWERQTRLMVRANEYMSSLGVSGPTKSIPLKFAVPLFQAASLEDDDYIQDLWARLLVNVSVMECGIEPKRMYIDILERLSPLEAQILEKIYGVPGDDRKQVSILTGDLPHSAALEREGEQDFAQPDEDVTLALANLTRLGCISLPTTWNGGQLFTSVYRTIIGQNLIRACEANIES